MLFTDFRQGEASLIAGNEVTVFEIRSLTGDILAVIPPRGVWTHQKLLAAVEENKAIINEAFGADFYLGESFVGSTEV
ncbi:MULTISPECIES: hypothetical protein [Herbaspirillum]|uniref:Uncharacterized protein n=2 Tax=Herbaspirillum huttiense TaxID=863372 RepID=A0AAJ2HAG2_9BURK|nr:MULTISPECIES: hypothetical protein [Herbaspirillum]MDR9836891.1 hypothetical protein [Herbaspirillum huttiense]